MKKLSILILLLALLSFALTGCVSGQFHLTINKDGSSDLEYRLAVNPALLSLSEDDNPIEEMKKDAKSQGFSVSTYAEGDLIGIKAKKHFKNPDDLKNLGQWQTLSDQNAGIEADKAILTVDKGLFTDTYKIDTDFDLTGMRAEGEFSEFTNLMLSQIKLKFILTLPYGPESSNASATSDDGETLEWVLIPGQHNEIEAVVKVPNMRNIAIAGIFGIVLLGLAVGFIIIRKKKNTSPGEPGTPPISAEPESSAYAEKPTESSTIQPAERSVLEAGGGREVRLKGLRRSHWIAIASVAILVFIAIALVTSKPWQRPTTDKPGERKQSLDETKESAKSATPTTESTVPKGKIAFVRAGDIWLMSPDGSGQENLTNSPDIESSPSWSPDGKQLVFSRGKSGGEKAGEERALNSQIWEIDLVSSKEKQVTSVVGEEVDDPAYTPDGSGILFQSWSTKKIPDEFTDYPLEHYKYKLNLLNLKTNERKTIKATEYLYEAGMYSNPFMPNIDEIYHSWWVEGSFGIGKINVRDMSEIENVTYKDIPETETYELSSIAISKNNLVAGALSSRFFIKSLTENTPASYYSGLESCDLTPQAFSPDNKKLVFTQATTGDDFDDPWVYSIWVLEIDQSKPRKVANDASSPAWQP